VIDGSWERINIGMHKPRLPLGTVAMIIVISGCGASTKLAHVQRPNRHRQSGQRYELYTHCGIAWARIDGRWWRAQHPLSDGNGNPPAGWGNPFQDGTLTLTGKGTARFDSAAGTVTFERTERTNPPFICS
jgi:hypothetical protein